MGKRRYKEIPAVTGAVSAWHDLIGAKLGRLTIIGNTGALSKRGRKIVTCLCDCGYYVDVDPGSLRSGATTSCGCLRREMLAARNKANATHGDSSGGTVTYLYRAWQALKWRCLDRNHDAYKHYGARGITVYTPWIDDYALFKKDVLDEIGEKPSRRHSLDRINNDRGYEPGNIGWSVGKEQVRNKRNTRHETLRGVRKPLAEWCDQYGADYEIVLNRISRLGWPLEDALTKPPGGGGRYPTRDRDLKGRWYMMIDRCHNPDNSRHADYGGRGITVCIEWRESFDRFCNDVGEQPSPQHTIDRFPDSNGNYEPGNVRWATSKQQNRNRRSVKKYELCGQLRTLPEWAELAGMPFARVSSRVRQYRWPLDEALGTPIGFGRCSKADRRSWSPQDA